MKSPSRHPFDIFPPMEQLRNEHQNMDAEHRNRLKTSVALGASDPRVVAVYVDIDGDDWANIYPPMPERKRISTGNAIDKFIETYGNPSPEENQLLERLIFNPAPEYGSVLARRDREEGNADIPDAKDNPTEVAQHINGTTQQAATDEIEIIGTADTPLEPQMVAEIETNQAAQSGLTIELAKIFVKQGQFQRARDIISKIILNNPEKSIYFADQLRFLDKLIKINNQQNTIN